MPELDLLLTLTGSLAAALLCGYLTFRLGLSPIVGYLLAGVVVGPNTPGFVANTHLAEQLAEVGVILLMFGVGLQFHVKELLAVRRVAIPGAVIRSLAASVLGCLIGRAYGWNWSASLVFGLALSIASTVVLIRVLADNDDLQTETGRVAVGWLIVEDLFTVLALVLLPAVFGTDVSGGGGLVIAIALALLKVATMVALMFIIGERVIPWILTRVAATRSRELFTLTVLVLALGIAVGSARFFGISMPLGAFLAGLVVGRSEFSLRAATEALPIRDAFAVLFFVSIGILFRPGDLMKAPGLIAATLAVILLAKPLATLAVMLGFRYPLRTAVAVGIATAQIGEFSFLLSATGKNLGILDSNATNTLVAAGIISITLNPLLYRFIDPIEAVLRRVLGTRPSSLTCATTVSAEKPRDEQGQYRAVVVGYGPVGQTLVRILRENKLEPAVIELNLQTVRELASEGVFAVYGDAASRQTLVDAGLAKSVALILSSANARGITETIRLAREVNPQVRIIARATYVREIAELRRQEPMPCSRVRRKSRWR